MEKARSFGEDRYLGHFVIRVVETIVYNRPTDVAVCVSLYSAV